MFNWRSYAAAKEQVQYKFTKIVLNLRDRHENANIFASFPPVRPTSKQSNNLYVGFLLLLFSFRTGTGTL